MTRASIVQRLLEAELINAEEAVILLNDKPNTNYIPYQPYQPSTIKYPDWGPYWTITSTTPPSFSSSSWEYPDTKFTPPTDN